jgi:hypothetical protein
MKRALTLNQAMQQKKHNWFISFPTYQEWMPNSLWQPLETMFIAVSKKSKHPPWRVLFSMGFAAFLKMQ